MLNFWWSAGLVDGLEPHLPPLSRQRSKMLIFASCSTSDDRLGWSMDSTTCCHLFSRPKNEMLIFGLHSTSDDWPGWSMDSNPICHPSPTKKMKCFFLDYVQLLMIGQAGRWIQTHLAPLSSQKKMLVFGLCSTSDDLVNGFKPHPPPISSQKKWNAHFWITTSDDQPGWSMDSNPICHPSPTKKCSFLDYVQLVLMAGLVMDQTPSAIQLLMIGLAGHGLKPHLPPLSSQKWNAHFWIMFNFWWSAGLVDGLEPHLPPLSRHQKNEMLVFALCSTSDDRPGWSMDSNPVCYPSPTKKMKCSFLDYVQLLMIGQVGRWTQTPSATPLQPKKWNACFWIMFNFWWSARLAERLQLHLQPLSNQKMKCLFLYYVIVQNQPCWSMDSKPIHSPSSQKNEMLVFGLCSTSDDWPGWSMDSNCIHYPSPAKKMKMLIFGLHSTSDDWPGWSMDLNPIALLSQAKKNEMPFLDYV